MGLVIKTPKECLVCLNSMETAFVPNEESQKILSVCCSYVKDAINIDFLINNIIVNNSSLSFCKNCVDWSMNLSQLVEQLSNLKKEINDLTSSFAEIIAKQRERSQATARALKQQFDIVNAQFQATDDEVTNLDSSDKTSLHQFSSNSERNSFVDVSDDLLVDRIATDEIDIKIVKTESHAIFLDYEDENDFDNASSDKEEDCYTNELVTKNENDPLEQIVLEPNSEIVNSCNITTDESKLHILTPKSLSELVSLPVTNMPNTRSNQNQNEISSCNNIFLDSIVTSYQDIDKPGVKLNKNLLGGRHSNCNSTIKSTKLKKGSYNCSICRKSFFSSSALKEHHLIHIVLKPYKCSLCEKTFRRSDYLKTHESRTHKRCFFKCSFCKKSYLRIRDLRIHERTHNEEKPYKCSNCKMTFMYPVDLRDHEATHTGEKSYKCHYCEIRFTSRCSRSRHQRKNHSDNLIN